MKKFTLVLLAVVAVTACDSQKSRSPLGPSQLVTDGDGRLLSSVFEIFHLGGGKVSIKYYGEPKLSIPSGSQPPTVVIMPDAMGNPAESINTIQDLVFDDHTCGSNFKRIRMQFATASPSDVFKSSGTYVEFLPCGKMLDLTWGIRMMDGKTYHSGNRFTKVDKSNINARLAGDRIISDSWP